jgi:hypothetical protein
MVTRIGTLAILALRVSACAAAIRAVGSQTLLTSSAGAALLLWKRIGFNEEVLRPAKISEALDVLAISEALECLVTPVLSIAHLLSHIFGPLGFSGPTCDQANVQGEGDGRHLQ